MTDMVELRRGTPTVGWTLIVVGAAMAAGAVYLAVTVAPEAGLLGVFALGPIAVGAWGLVHRIRIFDDGVEVWTFFARTRLRYSDIDRMTYRMVNARSHGVSMGYYVGLVLRGAGRKVTFLGRLEGRNREHLEAVRDRVADAIVTSALEKLGRGEEFAWTPRGHRVRLRNDGLAFRPQRFVGYGDEEVVPYSAGFTCTSSREYFTLRAGDRQLFMVSANGDDFYSGLLLFERLVRRDGGGLAAVD